MSRCPACGHENPAGGKFCSECGTPLNAGASVAREERKVVTVLFADLVGFTSRSEQLDPEDVRAFLSPYYTRLRTELERFGGTVEKFIGDAVMALFGAPIAHEDDPERAVRAALAIRDWVAEEGQLQLRIGVNTGEALIALGARPGQGEGMASGDVVNTTARLQTAAPVNGILVGEVTYRATSQVVNYRAAEPVTAKGKALPVPAWEALDARSRFGVDLGRQSGAALSGRQREMGVLRDALQRIRTDSSTQLVTLAGVPGMGKSRLVAELFRVIADDPSELITWRQGRSLPYGDGVTLWALSEMVKAQAGILETDTPGEAETKLEASVAGLITDGSDARWVGAHLRPLAGLSAESTSGGDRHEEAFAAWRRYLEALAEQGPLVLVFEDLHWADDNLLDFVEHLVEWAGAVPLLVVCTTRPELFDRRAGWGGGMRNSTTLWLDPLSEEETAQLISNLSDQALITAGTRQALLERAGGNPLYAEQYVRMLEERHDGEELGLPETVQGIIAARLDALPDSEKRLLQTAAVIGKVFWMGALTQVSETDRRGAEVQLHTLERRDFVQRARRSTVADESEYSFLHVLVRDVAYGQIPRGQRAEQHRLAAEWIASLGRTEDHAEMLAHHYRNILELQRAVGQPIDARLAELALESLRGAGDRAFSLNAFPGAGGFYESALELAPDGSQDHARLLFQLGRTRHIAGDLDIEQLTKACDELLAVGDLDMAAEAEAELADVLYEKGDIAVSWDWLNRARALVEPREPSPSKAHVLRAIGGSLTMAGESSEAIRVSREALEIAEVFGLDEVRARALNNIATARIDADDMGGMEDYERSLAIAVAANAPDAICRTLGNMSATTWQLGRLAQAQSTASEAHDVASRFGLVGWIRHQRGDQVPDHFTLGHWSEALEVADELLATIEAGASDISAPFCYTTRSQIRLARGDLAGSRSDVEKALALMRGAEAGYVLPLFARSANILWEHGDHIRAGLQADQALAWLRTGKRSGTNDHLHVLAWTLSAQGRGRELPGVLPRGDSLWVRAAAAFAEGDVRQAADSCGDMGAVTEEARDRLWLAESLIKQGLRAEADAELERALAFYRSVGATRYIRECEALLSASA